MTNVQACFVKEIYLPISEYIQYAGFQGGQILNVFSPLTKSLRYFVRRSAAQDELVPAKV